jgi:hypothetical protein
VLPAPNLDDLAGRIRERLGPIPSISRGPYILFLGEGCARAAGAPSREDLAREALKAFKYEPAEASKDKSGKELFEQFRAHTSSLSGSQFTRMLRSLYANVPVPSFYQDLALLIREQYFPLVVTMNFDTLLEQALAGVGVRSSQYRVTTFGRGRTSSQPDPSAAPLTHLVKLHGDLAQDIAHLTPDEIENALSASKSWIKADLAGDIIMVAHEMSNDPVDRWLAHNQNRELWWVSQDPPADPSRVSSWTSQAVQEVTGDLGRPNVFFSQLAHRLLRAPEAIAMETPVAAGELESVSTARSIGLPADVPLSETLQLEILRNQAVLYNLEQDRSAAQENPQLQAQILYQKRRMSRLEERFRSLPEVQRRVLDVVNRIASRIRTASVPPRPAGPSDEVTDYTLEDLASYVDRQADAVAQELESSKPNQLLISASLSATLAVADRLHTEYGDVVVNTQDVKQLAALVPTAAGKVVL